MKKTTIKAFCLMLISTMTLIANAQPKNYHLLTKVEKEQKSLELIDQAEYMVEGEMLDREFYYGSDGKTIYTRIIFQVDHWYKGKGKKVIHIIKKGGVIGLDQQYSMHRSDPYVRKLRKSFLLLSKRNKDDYEFLLDSSSISGRYSTSRKDDFYIKAFCGLKFDSKEDFHALVVKANKIKLPVKKKDVGLEEAKNNPSIVITSISPTTGLVAGVGQTITITGDNFTVNNSSAQGEILFISADEPFDGHLGDLDSDYIQSWTKTEIVVTVPSNIIAGGISGNAAGSGTIRVRRSDNEELESEQEIDIEYSFLNYGDFTNNFPMGQSYMGREHCLNGKVFTLHESFKPGSILDDQQSPKAIQAVEDALEAWSNELGITLELEKKQGGDYQYVSEIPDLIEDETSATNAELASRNVIYFTTTLSNGEAVAEAETSRLWQDCTFFPDDECTPTPWNFRNNIAIKIIPNIPNTITWEYDRTVTINYIEKYDFYAVILHEIGHALGLGHDIDLTQDFFNMMAAKQPIEPFDHDPEERISLDNHSDRAKAGAQQMVQDSKNFDWTSESQVRYGLESLSETNSMVLETPEISVFTFYPLYAYSSGLLIAPYQPGGGYNWLPNGASRLNPVRVCSNNNDYYVRIKNAGCTISSLYSLPVELPLSGCPNASDQRDDETLLLYPNPTTGQLNIEFERTEEKKIDERDTYIGIYDNLGRLQKQHQVSDSTLRQTTIDISTLPTGTYWVVWFADGEVIDTQQVQKAE